MNLIAKNLKIELQNVGWMVEDNLTRDADWMTMAAVAVDGEPWLASFHHHSVVAVAGTVIAGHSDNLTRHVGMVDTLYYYSTRELPRCHPAVDDLDEKRGDIHIEVDCRPGGERKMHIPDCCLDLDCSDY